MLQSQQNIYPSSSCPHVLRYGCPNTPARTSTVPSIEAVYFFYGDMAHAYLDVKQYNKALEYACALIHMGKTWNDNEGYLTGLTAYIHIASATDNYDVGIRAYNELLDKDKLLNKQREQSEVYQIFVERLSEQKNGERAMPEFLMPEFAKADAYSKPKSYKYLSSQLSAAHEMAIRSTMKEMGIGRHAVMRIMGNSKKA